MAKISKETIGSLSEWLDELIELKGLAEQFDGFAFKTGLNILNNKFGDLIPDELTPAIEAVILDVVNSNYQGAKEKLSALFAQIIKTPFIDGTEEEAEAYQMLLSAIEQLIKSFAKPKAA